MWLPAGVTIGSRTVPGVPVYNRLAEERWRLGWGMSVALATGYNALSMGRNVNTCRYFYSRTWTSNSYSPSLLPLSMNKSPSLNPKITNQPLIHTHTQCDPRFALMNPHFGLFTSSANFYLFLQLIKYAADHKFYNRKSFTSL